MVKKCTGRGLVVKQPGVLSKVQMLNLVLGVVVFSLLPNTLFSSQFQINDMSITLDLNDFSDCFLDAWCSGEWSERVIAK